MSCEVINPTAALPELGADETHLHTTHTGMTEAEKETFREELERLAGLSDGQTMLCVAGDFNAHIGVIEPGEARS